MANGINICAWHAAGGNGAFQKVVEIDGNPVLFSDLMTVKPTFSFEFIDLNYVEQADRFDRTVEVTTDIGGEPLTVVTTVMLTDEEKAEVLANINTVTPPVEFYVNFRNNQINGAYNQATNALAGQCDQYETASWEVQKSEALAWENDNTTATPFIDQLLMARNDGKPADEQESKAILVAKIVGKVAAYNTAYAGILGTYQARIKRLSEVTTLEGLISFVM